MIPDMTMWCFEYFYHMDKANACVHNAPVKFSPITFGLFQQLLEFWSEDIDITQEMAEVNSHLGTYDLDPGR